MRTQGKWSVHVATLAIAGAVAWPALAAQPIYTAAERYDDGVEAIGYTQSDGPGSNHARIVQILRDRGYTEVKVIGPRAPVYAASACRDGIRYALDAGSDGRVSERQRLGTCAGYDGTSKRLSRTTREIEEYDARASYPAYEKGSAYDACEDNGRWSGGYPGKFGQECVEQSEAYRPAYRVPAGEERYGASYASRLRDHGRRIAITFRRNSADIGDYVRPHLDEFAAVAHEVI